MGSRIILIMIMNIIIGFFLLLKLPAGDDHLVPGLCIALPQDEQLGSENLSTDNFAVENVNQGM